MRTARDLLYQEYFDLLPEIRRVQEEIETEARCTLLPLSLELQHYERTDISSRVKGCESAVTKLRGPENREFDDSTAESYTPTTLGDLAALRVLVFPRRRLDHANALLRERFPDWVRDETFTSVPRGGRVIGLKYSGFSRSSSRIRGEYQVVPMMTGLIWRVEHPLLYKPSQKLKDYAEAPNLAEPWNEVLSALEAFETAFEKELRKADQL